MANRFQSDYSPGDDNIQMLGLDVHNPVFFISSALIILFVIATLQFPEQANEVLTGVRTWCLTTFDSFAMLSVNLLLLFCIALIVSPFGSLRIGGDSATAEYSRASWFAMLFAAGMGIGLMFWGVAEPVAYFTDWAGTPFAVEPWTDEAAQLAMAASVYHWGIHAWAIYAVVALALAFFAFNCGLPLTLRSVFYPLLGERCWGWMGDLIDIFAVLATIFGLATSLGLGAAQINSGLTLLFGVEDNFNTKLSVIILITFITVISVMRGLRGGVKVLSNINMVFAAGLLLFVAVVGSGFIEHIFSVGSQYFANILPLSNWVARDDNQWMRDWTVFYWAWWVSWSPFVGLFIARISKGRTVREFLLAVMVIPTGVTIVWFGIFGGNAIAQAQAGTGALAEGVSSISVLTFQMLENLPFAETTTLLGMVLILIFFITSADSGSLVIDSITAGGKLDAPAPQRIYWAIMLGMIASILLYGGGKEVLSALQAGTVATGIPFTALVLLICISLTRGLMQSLREARTIEKPQKAKFPGE